MLRPRPTVISLTRTDVTEVVHRRRFRRFLECDDDVCIAFTPAETETMGKPSRHKPSSSRPVERMKTPAMYGATGGSSPPAVYSRVRPLVADLPLHLPPGKGREQDISPPSDTSSNRAHQSKAGGGQQQGAVWTPQLCLRPKPSVPLATTANLDVDSDGSAESHGSLENPREESPVDEQKTERGVKSEAGPSTPRRRSSSESPGSPPTCPVMSAQVCPVWSRSHAQGLLICPSEVSSSAPTLKTPRRGLRVYNDFLPASSQPQTPQNLPEARYQSRLQGSYTAPARRISPQPAWTPTMTRPRRGVGRRRELSPLGLQTPGFRGLYGGAENMDDAALVEDMADEMARSWASTTRPGSSA
ncbi:hypothetical protein C8A01DRAFT_13636 [Parachaetomium inaequale]|uniref:Uncharacterized protein n=1 Tax=Parachaetomium inaequale TaxID=2588326 RepID=A0AAN6PL18_9PEZI|nr:hypothetical protein C8A01DRAFT_13636 [Parachaetomium inaequale]